MQFKLGHFPLGESLGACLINIMTTIYYGVLKLSLFNLVAFDEFLKGKHFAVKLQKIERLQIQAIMTNYFKVS